MLITFFDSKGIIHKEIVLTGQTITGAYYLEALNRLMTRIRSIRPEYRDPETWSLLHNNAPSHTSLIVHQFLAPNQVCIESSTIFTCFGAERFLSILKNEVETMFF